MIKVILAIGLLTAVLLTVPLTIYLVIRHLNKQDKKKSLKPKPTTTDEKSN